MILSSFSAVADKLTPLPTIGNAATYESAEARDLQVRGHGTAPSRVSIYATALKGYGVKHNTTYAAKSRLRKGIVAKFFLSCLVWP
jgi:hypothetical protein